MNTCLKVRLQRVLVAQVCGDGVGDPVLCSAAQPFASRAMRFDFLVLGGVRCVQGHIALENIVAALLLGHYTMGPHTSSVIFPRLAFPCTPPLPSGVRFGFRIAPELQHVNQVSGVFLVSHKFLFVYLGFGRAGVSNPKGHIQSHRASQCWCP
jgi:hypothetical protein